MHGPGRQSLISRLHLYAVFVLHEFYLPCVYNHLPLSTNLQKITSTMGDGKKRKASMDDHNHPLAHPLVPSIHEWDDVLQIALLPLTPRSTQPTHWKSCLSRCWYYALKIRSNRTKRNDTLLLRLPVTLIDGLNTRNSLQSLIWSPCEACIPFIERIIIFGALCHNDTRREAIDVNLQN